MTKAELDFLERVFAAEIDGRVGWKVYVGGN
jgi:hypothetical protein